MPYLRVNTHPLTKLIKSYGFNGENLSEILRCSPTTARTKINEPQRLTVEDLESLARYGHIPVDEIRGAITRGY